MDNGAKTRQLFDVINAGALDALDDLVDASFVEHEAIPGFARDREGLRKFFAAILAAFSDFTMTIDDLAVDGDKVWVRVTMRGNQRGEFLGIPASGKSMAVPIVDILRFANGRVVEHWGVMDSGVMLQQLS